MTFVNDIRGFEATTISRMTEAFKSVGVAYDKRRDFNKTVRELNALSFDELEDLGIARADIADIAYQAVYART